MTAADRVEEIRDENEQLRAENERLQAALEFMEKRALRKEREIEQLRAMAAATRVSSPPER